MAKPETPQEDSSSSIAWRTVKCFQAHLKIREIMQKIAVERHLKEKDLVGFKVALEVLRPVKWPQKLYMLLSASA